MDGLEIKTFSLGELLTNAYLIINRQTNNCLLIDAPPELFAVNHFLKKITITFFIYLLPMVMLII